MSNQKTTNNRYADTVRLVLEDRAESVGHRVFSGVSGATKMHILLDVLLTDRWEMALRKVALATTAARPDIVFTADHMRAFVAGGFDTNRRRCLHFVRRLQRDEQGLDLLWLMLAATPNSPWTYGFMDRLTAAFSEMHDNLHQVEEGLMIHATMRFERWQFIADGFPSAFEDPFKAVTDKAWSLAKEKIKEREKQDRAAAAVAAASEWRKTAPSSIRELVTVDERDVDDAQESISEYADGVQVLPPDFKGVGLYKPLVATLTPLALTPDLRSVRDALRNEFPHAWNAIDLMLGDLRPGEPLHFRPFMLLGAAGSGKSRMVRRLCDLMGVRLRRFDGAGSSDNAFGGVPRRWSNASPCFVLQTVADSKVANPVILVDEVDKSGSSTAGSLVQSLLPFLESETSRAYPDPCFEVEADLSHVNYCMTANDDTRLPSPLRDRIRIIRLPSPGVEHIESLARSIMQDLEVELAIPPAFMPALAPDELAVVARAWGEKGSVRRLQKIVRGTVTARDQHAVRH